MLGLAVATALETVGLANADPAFCTGVVFAMFVFSGPIGVPRGCVRVDCNVSGFVAGLGLLAAGLLLPVCAIKMEKVTKAAAQVINTFFFTRLLSNT